MAGNTLGRLFAVTTFGESHGPAIGCVIDGCPPGMALDVGLMASDTRMSCPVLMPPRMPPASLPTKPSGVSSSPCCEPRWATDPKPAPISTPLTALMAIIAWAMSASSRS